jgi:hypothetical protein
VDSFFGGIYREEVLTIHPTEVVVRSPVVVKTELSIGQVWARCPAKTHGVCKSFVLIKRVTAEARLWV